MKRISFVIILALAFGTVLTRGSVFAAEGGTGHYVPGAMADFGDMAPPSGLAFLDWYNHYHGSAGVDRQFEFGKQIDFSKQLPFGRQLDFSRTLEFGGNLVANAKATSNAEMFGAVYTFPCGILDGKFSTGVIVPYIWLDVTATGVGAITGPLGRTLARGVTRTDTASGIGDITFIPFWLGWNRGDFRWAVQLDVYAPTGEYNVGQLANVGLNYWTFEPMVSFSYISKKIGLEISTTAGFDFNTNNGATDYQSGDVFHMDVTIAEHLPLCNWGIFGVGVNGYYWKQFTGDSGSGAQLGSFETQMSGVGPVVSYISPKFAGGHTVVAEVKWLPQMDTLYTLKGDYIWFKASLSF